MRDLFMRKEMLSLIKFCSIKKLLLFKARKFGRVSFKWDGKVEYLSIFDNSEILLDFESNYIKFGREQKLWYDFEKYWLPWFHANFVWKNM